MTPGAAQSGRRWGVAAGVMWLSVFVGTMLAGLALWVRLRFGRVTVDQFLMHLPFGEGAAGVDRGLAFSAVLAVVVIPALLVAMFIVLVSRSRRALLSAGYWRGKQLVIVRVVAFITAVLVPLWGSAMLGSSIGARQYLRSVTTPYDIADYYAVPEATAQHTGDGSAGGGEPAAGSESAAAMSSRNLVVIYLESIEDAFADEELFGTNMLQPVTTATTDWGSIDGLRQADGGGWTMAGIVATQCGIPLRGAEAVLDHSSRNEIGAETERYMPNAVCLGDVLAEAGYRNIFLGGADPAFASKGRFLRDHGYQEVRGLDAWREMGETELRSDWGLSDRRLFAHAADEVDRLHASGEPFHLAVLTLDTHESPFAHEYCRSAANAANEEMSAITRCSMEQVAGFIEHLDTQGYLDDTAVVVMGDHTKMAAEWASFWEELDGLEQRTIFNRVWSPDGVAPLTAGVDQFAVYPTLLELTGMHLRDHRAGLGVSALADEMPEGSAAALDPDAYLELVQSRSAEFYAHIWGE